MNLGKLFGKLLNYPDCCIEHFQTGGGWTTNGDVHYHGFVPCPEHAKLSYDELVKIIGRDLENEPKEFREFSDSLRGKLTDEIILEKGFKAYEKVEKEVDFLLNYHLVEG